MVKTNSDTFKKEIKDNELVIVDFYADWCGPCKMVSPVMEEIDRDYKDLVKVLKVNVDEEMQLSQMFSITSIPTIILFKNGTVVNRMMGFRTKSALLNIINNYR